MWFGLFALVGLGLTLTMAVAVVLWCKLIISDSLFVALYILLWVLMVLLYEAMVCVPFAKRVAKRSVSRRLRREHRWMETLKPASSQPLSLARHSTEDMIRRLHKSRQLHEDVEALKMTDQDVWAEPWENDPS